MALVLALLAAVVLAVTIVAVVAVGAVVIGPGGGPLTTTGFTTGYPTASGTGRGPPGAVHRPGRGPEVYVAGPGDSLWSIVRASGVRGDPRPVVDRLEHELGGGPLQVGQQVVVP